MSKSSSGKEIKTYLNNQIENNAKQYGYKAANLINLQNVIERFSESKEARELKSLHGEVQLAVPAFTSVDQAIIRQHLYTHSPSWKEQFEAFQEAFASQDNQGSLGEDAKKKLQELQGTITQCFKDHPLSEQTINKFLQDNQIEPGSLLMVRSTGIHEDRADMANPGGNESVPCRATVADISEALGRVAASYIGEKSLSQRLGSGDKSISDMPVMPGLIQKLVGEGLDGRSPVSSGVVYTNGGSTRMQAAPGHGEYVVNSKGRVDNYYISSEGLVYSEVASKDFRLAASVSIEGDRSVSLERKENDSELKYSPAIDPDAAVYLHELSKFIEKKYGTRVDIEFVYKPASQIESASINIVQVRAIPEGNRRGLEPAALSPKFLGENKDKLQTLNGLQVITPEVNRAAVITVPKEVIIASNIEQALSEYNKLGQDGRTTIKAVVIQNPAPDTSHEAGVFNAGGIAVMQVKYIEEFRKLLPNTEGQQAIIVDPQHSKIYQLPKELGTDEQKLYDSGVLAKGIYASALSNYVTPVNYDFSKVKTTELGKQPVATEGVLQDKTLATLVAQAKTGNTESLNQLLSVSYKVVAYGQEKNQAAAKDKLQILHDNIDLLTSPKIGDDNKDLREALGYNLRTTFNAYKKGYISQEIFKQTMIAGTELSVLLDRMAQQKPEELNKEQQDKIYLEYFNVQKKFTGLNINSLATSIKNHKYQELAEKLAPKITGEAKEYLIESLKLGDYLINHEQRNNWNKFCASNCTAEDGQKRLSSLVNKLVTYNTHEQWINYIFADSNDPKEPQATLAKLEEDFTKIDLSKIKTASDLIKSMESQIPEWSNPAKFNDLYKELQTNLQTINDNLQWNKDATNLEKILITQQVHHLVEIMDKSTKSLERSNLYTDNMLDDKGNNLQVVRFRDMITQFHDQIMTPWLKNAIFEGIDELDSKFRLANLLNFLNQTNFRLLTAKELFPSPNFSVNIATIDIPGAKHSAPKTLEDIFTLVHQNCLVSLNNVTKDLNKIIEKQYPDLVKKLEIEFNNGGVSAERQVIIPSTSINLQNKELIINKNIPLRDHSAIVRIKYYNNDISLEFQMFGPNEGNRWDYVMLDNYFGLMHGGYEFIKKPYFDQDKLVTSFEVRVDNARQITPIISAINHSIQQSYQYSYNNYSIDKARHQCIKRLKLLEELYQKFPEKRLELGNIHFIPSSYINLAMLKNIPDKSEFINHNYNSLLSCPIMYSTVSNAIFGLYNNLNGSIKANYFIKNSRGVVNLIKSGLNIETILTLYDTNHSKLHYFIQNSRGIVNLTEVGLKIETITKLYEDKTTNSMINYLINKGWQINILVKSGLNIETINTLYDKNLDKFEYFIKEVQKIKDLAESGFSINDLSKLYDNPNNNLKVKYFIEKSYSVKDLVNSGLESEKLLKLYDNDRNKLEYFISKGLQIRHLIEYGVKNLFELYDNKRTNAKAKYFIDEKWGIVKLIESGLNVETINTLYDKNLDKLKYFIDKSDNVKSIIELRLFTKDEILELYDNNFDKAKLFIEKNQSIEILNQLGLNSDVLKTLYDKNSKSIELIIEYTYEIKELVKNQFPLKNVVEICINKVESFKVIIKNKEKVYSILEQKQFSPEDLSKCNPDQIQNLLDGRIKPADLKKELFIKQHSINKEIHGPNSERIIRTRSNSPISPVGNVKK